MTRYFRYELAELPKRPLRDWGKYRWQDNLYTVLWLYNRTGDRQLLSLASLLHEQGYDWEAQFANFKYTSKETRQTLGLEESHPLPDAAMQTHGVNNAMALKAAPIWWLVSGKLSDRSELSRQLGMLDQYHGLPNGIFSADEHFAGPDPSQGVELCTVVETMFSYEQAFAILGDPNIADRLERVSYNALPAATSNDMWSHQYDQQPNQIACTRAPRQWSTNGPDSNLFGLAPNFGCCTANLHQGWPKFVANMWMTTQDEGLVAAAYGPSEVYFKVEGEQVSVLEDTDYPFRGNIRFVVHTGAPQIFSLVLRIPEWAASANIQVNGKWVPATQQANVPGGFYPIRRRWQDGDAIDLTLSIAPRVTHWYHDSAVFERGPLVFALPLDGKWTELKKYAQGSADWEVTPTCKWNYAVEIGLCAATVMQETESSTPFDAEHPAVALHVHGRQLLEWTLKENSAGPLPISPVSSKAPLRDLRLVPYGAAKVRITAFPYLSDAAPCSGETGNTPAIMSKAAQRFGMIPRIRQRCTNSSCLETWLDGR
jgi:hypothetical protein